MPDLPLPEKRKTATPRHIGALLKRQDYTCASCPTKLAEMRDRVVHILVPFDVDHIQPLDLLGKNTPDNLQCLCGPCHKAKTASDIAKIAKGRRIRGEVGQLARRKRLGPTIKKPPGYISPLSSKNPRYRT